MMGTAQAQRQTSEASSKLVLRVCVDLTGTRAPKDYATLISALRNEEQKMLSASNFSIVPVPLFGEARNTVPVTDFSEVAKGCSYILRLGKVETKYWNVIGDKQPNEGHYIRSEVPFSLLRPGNEKPIVHDVAAAMAIQSAQAAYSQHRLMAIVAQRALHAIQPDQWR